MSSVRIPGEQEDVPGRGVVGPRAWGLVASEVAVLFPPPAEPASFWLLVGCLVYSGPMERSARCGWPGLCAEGSTCHRGVLAGRRAGRRWGLPVTFAAGWARKESHCNSVTGAQALLASGWVLFPSFSLVPVIAHMVLSLWYIQFCILRSW